MRRATEWPETWLVLPKEERLRRFREGWPLMEQTVYWTKYYFLRERGLLPAEEVRHAAGA